MVTRAVVRYIRISPRKTRKVIDLVRGLPVVKAEIILDTINKRPSLYIKRLLMSALDSADKKFSLSSADLYISSIRADQGPMLKRYRAASMGRATMIRHRTTHIALELEKIKRPVKKIVETEKVKKTVAKRTGRIVKKKQRGVQAG
ncbi:50S ribosomal protein L22 [Candidatus Omnitrophota bacterium]